MKERRMRSNSKKRFGHAVKFEDYKTSRIIKIASLAIAVIIIPLEIFMESLLTNVEIPMIASI